MGEPPITVRVLRPDSDAELNTIVAFTMMTLWETLPEAREAPETVPSFSFDAMKANFRDVVSDPTYRFLVAEEPGGMVCGHACFKVVKDSQDVRYGHCHTRYVLPGFRRRGAGSLLLERALEWFRSNGAAYALAHTHETNTPLVGLFERHGFEVIGRSEERFPMLVLRRDLPV